MQGRVCIITGATNGIGEVSALELAKLGAKIVIIGRNETRAKATIAKIKSAVATADVDYLIADLSLMRDVKKVAGEFREKYSRLDVLLNNAGMIFENRIVTAEGLEMTFALNHMNYFYLTHLLLDMLKASGTPAQKSRIINVASEAHRPWKLNFDDLQNEKGYFGARVYGQSKTMNIMHAYELHRRLSAEGAPITVNSLHPGTVRTGFGQNNRGIMKIVTQVLGRFGLSAEQGASNSIYLASSPKVEGISGQYFIKFDPKKAREFAMTPDNWTRLWSYSEDILQQIGI
jgi:NAD(P)-dependent dehydrogenase (short-subunit alcohol dehydrogenase family)